MSTNISEDAALFVKIGIDEKKAAETTKNKYLSSSLKALILEAGAENGCDKSAGQVLYTLAGKYPLNALAHRPKIAKLVVDKKINASNVQPSIDYLLKLGAADLDEEAFKKECGIGAVVTGEEISVAVASLLKEKKAELEEKRYRINVGLLLSTLRGTPSLRWADGKMLSDELNKQINTILGPRTAEDDKKPEKKKEEVKEKEKPAPKVTTDATNNENKEDDIVVEGAEMKRFPAPEENIQNTPELLKKHLEETGGKVVTRFPPEPNGYLHIGHAKAMHLDFGYAKKHGGVCYLRFDDTNPEKEEQEYFDNIIENVKWMGWHPWKITYSSHYFPQLYEHAVQLIKIGKAYVCHENKEQMQEGRQSCRDSPYRNRSVEENLKLFEDMRKGKFAEGEACLRMKGDMKSENPNMRDLVAYRVKFAPHPISGDKWCIYPSYDFTHCLVDSMENVTHSLCTLEFERRRESYNWLVDVLGLYRPLVWEFSRLNLTNTVLSKRKIIRLVKEKHVRGWDDPRLSTLIAFRRKGFTPEAINLMCEKIGVTRAHNTIPYSLLEQCCRLDLDPKVSRTMVVINPLKIILTNVKEGEEETISVRNHPYNDLGTHEVPFSRVVYIEKTDFRLNDEKGYYGLAPGKEVLLKYAYNIKCTNVVKDEKGEIKELHAVVDKNSNTKVKGVLHWVAESKKHNTPVSVEIRKYDSLFNMDNPKELGENWLSSLNPNSEVVIHGALGDNFIKDAKVGEKYQFERQGYYCVDKDSTPEKLVFNLTVTLKESKGLKDNKKANTTTTTSK